MIKFNCDFFRNGLVILNTNIEGEYIFQSIMKQQNLDLFNSMLLDGEMLIDKIRSANYFLSKKSDYQFLLIDKVHKLNKFCINAMLKVTENLPSNATIILVTNHPNFLLKTILSRAMIFKLPYELKGDFCNKIYTEELSLQDIIMNSTEYPVQILETYSDQIEIILDFLLNKINKNTDNKTVDLSFITDMDKIIIDSIPMMVGYIFKKILDSKKVPLNILNKIDNLMNSLSDIEKFDIKKEFIIISILEQARVLIKEIFQGQKA